MARHGHEGRLNPALADTSQGADPKDLDYAAWPAIGGDHSVSSANMVNIILESDWIMDVARVAASLGIGLETSTSRSERVARLRSSDLKLLKVDPDYVSRAGSNNVHFMISRPALKTTGPDYFQLCLKEGTEPNLIGTYTWYHTSAMLKAWQLAAGNLTPERQSELALAILADEAFSIHFLEDGFSAGHVAGIWGNAALRKGTHDYYDEHGLAVSTWDDNQLILTGDAYMRPVDADVAATTVMLSLTQMIDASTSKLKPLKFSDRQDSFAADTFNIASAAKMPARYIDPDFSDYYKAVLITTPIPGLATGLGEIPRFRSEIGPFIGIEPAGRISVVSGGFSPDQKTDGIIPRLELALHVGLGMDGVLNESGDGLVFFDLGWRLDGASSIKVTHDPVYNQFGAILSAVPSRQAIFMRFRMPFYLIPADFLVIAPIMMIFAPKKLNAVIATAGNGGLIPWQTGMITPIGRFQFILGREIGICSYGLLGGPDAFLIPDDREGVNQWSLITMKTFQMDFPVLEYRPFRTFSRSQSSSLVFQINAGVDIPGKVTMIEPANLSPVELRPIWLVGIRLGFDWRYYYAGKKS